MKKTKNNFVRCGFEFTAAKTPDTFLDSSLFDNYSTPRGRPEYVKVEDAENSGYSPGYLKMMEERERERLKNPTKDSQSYESFSVSSKYSQKHETSPYQWIRDRAHSDSCGVEIATPIVSSKEEIRKYYIEFMAFVRRFDLTTDLEEAVCGLGGCHIHFSIVQFTEVEKHYFLKNLAIFMTNCPELNWGFNDVNDNENANSLLSPQQEFNFLESYKNNEDKNMDNVVEHRESLFDVLSNLKSTVDKTYTPVDTIYTPSVSSCHDRKFAHKEEEKRRKGSISYKYRKDGNNFRIFVNHPLEFNLMKQYCIRYNNNYNTIEFRIFDMPTSLDRLLLHYDVAMAIYSLCYEKAKEKKVIKHTYKKYDYDLNKSIKRFYDCMDTLGITHDRVSQMVANIETRYHWNEIQKEKNYLL